MGEPTGGPALFAGSGQLDGNTAKVRVLHDLSGLLRGGRPLDVLDVGIVGVAPLHFWEPLIDHEALRLTGVDVRGIERAAAVARARGWARVVLRRGSGYRLTGIFAAESFDVVVATQVLEHVARLSRFSRQVAAVLRSGGQAFFTLDSAHFRRRYDPRFPVRLAKNLVRRGLSLLGWERYNDLPWRAEQVAAACRGAGLSVRAIRYYNLAPLKHLHNHVVTPDRQNAFLHAWFALEEMLNDGGEAARSRHLFRGLYVHAVKP